MARVTVYLPAELAARVEAELPGLNVSAVVQEALRGRLRCDHVEMACTSCTAVLTREEATEEAILTFWFELVDAIEPMVWRQATAEGAAAAIWRVAGAHGMPVGPVPRPTRAEREANAGRRWKDTG